jgi:hypothetical protein
MEDSVGFCVEDYSVFHEEKGPFAPKWQDISFSKSYSASLNHSIHVLKSFEYTKSNDFNSSPFFGKYDEYSGGGYVFKMKFGNLDDLVKNLTLLESLDWIDRQTRAVFVEFSLFNPNLNLFCYCNILLEILPTGNLLLSSHFSPINLLDISKNNFVSFRVIFNLIYLMMICFIMFKEARLLMREKFAYFLKFWNYIELVLIGFSWTAFSLYLYRMYSAYKILYAFKNSKSNEYINMQFSSYCNDLLGMCFGFCAACGTLRFLKLLRFNRKIIIFMIAFRNCARELLSFGLIFMIVWMSFVQTMYLIFNERSQQFSSIVKTMGTCFQMVLGKFEVDVLIKSNALFGTILFILYNLVIVCVLLSMFLTIIADYYSEISKEDDFILEEEDPEFFEYLKEKFLFLIPSSYLKNDNEEIALKSHSETFPEKVHQLVRYINRVNLFLIDFITI